MPYHSLQLSQYLNVHPIKDKNMPFKQRYLTTLSCFVHLLSDNNILTASLIDLFYENLLGAVPSNTLSESNCSKLFKKTISLQFEKFKLNTYCYALLIDCLFILCFDDFQKAEQVQNAFKSFCPLKYHQDIEKLVASIYHYGKTPHVQKVEGQLACWRMNAHFLSQRNTTFLVTANMSAGKSTLINALTGKSISRMKNEACTAKLHYIYNKPFEDDCICKKDGTQVFNADETLLLNNALHNPHTQIDVGAYFHSPLFHSRNVCFIDTPGVNFSSEASHRDLTYQAIGDHQFDKLIYVMNAENIGTFDDREYLHFIKQHISNQDICFVINKLDQHNPADDSINDTMLKVRAELIALGFEKPTICPVSAYAALLAKKHLYQMPMAEDELDYLHWLQLKFRNDYFNLPKYYLTKLPKQVSNYFGSDKPGYSQKCYELLVRSGLLHLEHVLTYKL